jgi:hypothetical protein
MPKSPGTRIAGDSRFPLLVSTIIAAVYFLAHMATATRLWLLSRCTLFPGLLRASCVGLYRSAADCFHGVGCSSHFRSFAPCLAFVASSRGRSTHRFGGGLRARTWREQIWHRTRYGAGCYACGLVRQRSPICHKCLRTSVLDWLRVGRRPHDPYEQSQMVHGLWRRRGARPGK